MEAKIQKWENNNKRNLIQEKDKIIISKPKKRHSTLEERIEMFESLPNNEKGSVESYDWGKNLGKEKLDEKNFSLILKIPN